MLYEVITDSAYADIVLPATTQYEITSYMRYGPIFKIREKLIEPVGEARNDFLILSELAERLGYGHLFPQSEEAILERALENSYYTLDEVRKAGGSVQVKAAMMQYNRITSYNVCYTKLLREFALQFHRFVF